MPYSVYPLGPLETNSYLVYKDGQAVVIDAGGDPAPILHDLRAKGLTLAAICLTHRHFDHMYGVATLVKETGAPVYSPVHDACLIGTESSDGGIWGFPPVPAFESRDLPTGQQVFGGMTCTVLDTPGHTPGGVSYYFPDEKAVFTGDALFYRVPWAARTSPAAITTPCCIPSARCSSPCRKKRPSCPVTARPPASATNAATTPSAGTSSDAHPFPAGQSPRQRHHP